MISGNTILSFFNSVLTLLQQEGLTTLATVAKQFFHGRFPETLAAQVFDDYIYICPIDRTEAHRKGLFVYFIFRNRHVVSPVEIRNDAARKVRVGVSVLIHQVVDQVERLELVVRIVVPVVMVSVEITHGNLAVLLVMELALGLVLFGLLLEDGVPTVNLVECLVEHGPAGAGNRHGPVP